MGYSQERHRASAGEREVRELAIRPRTGHRALHYRHWRQSRSVVELECRLPAERPLHLAIRLHEAGHFRYRLDTALLHQGMVEKAYTTAPVISQIAEEASQDELLKARYGGSSVNTARIKWLNNDLPKLKSSGINAAGQYSYAAYLLELGLYNNANRYTGDGGLRTRKPLALEYIMTLSDWAMRNAGAFKPPLAPSPVKNIYANIQATFCHGYEGRTPDVFDPHYYQAMLNALDFGAGRGAWSGNGNAIPDASRIYAVLSEDAADLHGVDARSHVHLGAAVLTANPYMSIDSHYSVVYRDPVLYSKLALRDLLKAKYKTIVALNAAWGTSYTNWNT